MTAALIVIAIFFGSGIRIRSEAMPANMVTNSHAAAIVRAALEIAAALREAGESVVGCL
jgi:hypothetical protein